MFSVLFGLELLGHMVVHFNFLSNCLRASFLSFFFFNIYLFIWLPQSLSRSTQDLCLWCVNSSCSIWDLPDQGSNPGLLHWKRKVLAIGPLGNSPNGFVKPLLDYTTIWNCSGLENSALSCSVNCLEQPGSDRAGLGARRPAPWAGLPRILS